MLCPAVSDPFHGRWYRICTIFHQTLAMPILGKFLTWSAFKSGLAKPGTIPEEKVTDILWGINQKENNCTKSNGIHNNGVQGQMNGFSSHSTPQAHNSVHTNDDHHKHE